MAQQGNEISPELIALAVKRVLASLNDPTGKSASTGSPSSAGKLDAKKDYPLAIKRPDLVKSATGSGPQVTSPWTRSSKASLLSTI